MTRTDRFIDRAGRIGQWVLLICVTVLVVYLLVGRAERDAQVASLAEALEASRQQVVDCADQPPGTPECAEPVVPPPDVIVHDPRAVVTTAPPTTIREFVPMAVLEAVARDAVEAALPDVEADARADLAAAVKAEVAACVESGECVGPSVPVETVRQLVVDAVAAFCADGACRGPQGAPGPTGPPGADGCCTVKEIERIADRRIAEYVVGREIWCYPEPTTTPQTRFGPCFMSVG